ncbi:methyl-accepting chemotaxis protein [Massilia sp. S19_KUP03_FR1]|uniref:methyl-accepting chemotaxis protein n=1 Tax=Massilia sp. S19_KUP03_FR1 TaxID=3025503 RepID=UPI002FCDA654
MGFASKLSINFAPKAVSGETVLSSPDSEFGAEPGTAAFRALNPGADAPAATPAATDATRDDGGTGWSLPLIGHLSLPRQLRVLLYAAAGGIAVTIFALWQNASSSAVSSAQTQIASDALMHSQRIGKAAPNSVQGNKDAFAQLQDSRAQLSNDLKILSDGGNFAGRSIPSPSSATARQLAVVKTKWLTSERAAGTIIATTPELLSFDKSIRTLDVISPELLALTDDLLTQKAARGGNPRELAAIGRLLMLTQRLSRSASEYLTSGGIRAETAFQLGKDTTAFRATVNGLLNGNEQLGLSALKDADLRELLEQINTKFDTYQEVVSAFLLNLSKLTAAKAAEQSIYYENEELKTLLSKLQADYRSSQDSTDSWFWLMVAASLFTLGMAASISSVMLQDSRNRTRGADTRRQEAESQRVLSQAKEEEAKATNDQNQAAILRLMNELQEVADGDLTVHATVSEDITGAIADSVNYTVEELRALVHRVTTTAEKVTTASNDARQVSTDLLDATAQQSREIQDASATVLKMASDITDVSNSASESADVARQSVAAAEQGATAVQNAIKGMIDIREQIQETSKRIKRLGESSQEIGEITELISDITEQTNVLALNAAIQAASAGEAGRGFSVVAEEVQRLAERSGDAAKQIGALVRTIQTDTHDAVAAMEKSTQGVVEGARLSDAAGAALNDISRVSNRLAELIQGISFATELQATSANSVAHNIQHILSVTEQTQDGTQQTAQSISQLALLAQELKNSVSRFRVAA